MTNIQYTQPSVDELVSLVKSAASDGQLHLLSAILKVTNNPAQLRGLAVEYAAKKGHLEIIQELLKNDAIISQKDRGKAVINAAIGGHLKVIQELLKNNAAITQQVWKYALRCAVENEHLEIVHALTENVHITMHSKAAEYWPKQRDNLS